MVKLISDKGRLSCGVCVCVCTCIHVHSLAHAICRSEGNLRGQSLLPTFLKQSLLIASMCSRGCCQLPEEGVLTALLGATSRQLLHCPNTQKTLSQQAFVLF